MDISTHGVAPFGNVRVKACLAARRTTSGERRGGSIGPRPGVEDQRAGVVVVGGGMGGLQGSVVVVVVVGGIVVVVVVAV